MGRIDGLNLIYESAESHTRTGLEAHVQRGVLPVELLI